MEPLWSRMISWKMRSPVRVGSTPFDVTSPMTVTSAPSCTLPMRVTVLASS
jgi:hypothetical protein